MDTHGKVSVAGVTLGLASLISGVVVLAKAKADSDLSQVGLGLALGGMLVELLALGGVVSARAINAQRLKAVKNPYIRTVNTATVAGTTSTWFVGGGFWNKLVGATGSDVERQIKKVDNQITAADEKEKALRTELKTTTDLLDVLRRKKSKLGPSERQGYHPLS